MPRGTVTQEPRQPAALPRVRVPHQLGRVSCVASGLKPRVGRELHSAPQLCAILSALHARHADAVSQCCALNDKWHALVCQASALSVCLTVLEEWLHSMIQALCCLQLPASEVLQQPVPVG